MAVRTFVQLRQMLSTNAELSHKLAAMEKNYDIKFKAIFEAIHQLMTPPTRKRNAPSALHREGQHAAQRLVAAEANLQVVP